MIGSLIVAALLVTLAAGLAVVHLRAKKGASAAKIDAAERNYLARQFRRRIQVSGMLAILGVAIALGNFLNDPLFVGIYWLGVILLTGWIMLLAAADLVSTHVHYLRTHHQLEAERAVLKAELARLQGHSENGHPPE